MSSHTSGVDRLSILVLLVRKRGQTADYWIAGTCQLIRDCLAVALAVPEDLTPWQIAVVREGGHIVTVDLVEDLRELVHDIQLALAEIGLVEWSACGDHASQ